MATQCLLDNIETGEISDDATVIYGCSACSRLAKSSKRSPCGHAVFVFKSLVHSRVTREICRISGIALGVATFIIGLRYRGSCHFEPAIPVFLMVLGSVLFLQTVFRTLLLLRPKIKTIEGENEGLDAPGTLIKIQVLFLILWILAGSVWIYSAKGVVQFSNPNTRNYCNQTAFWAAFGLVTAAYSVVVSIVIYFTLTYTVLRCKTSHENLRKLSNSSLNSSGSGSDVSKHTVEGNANINNVCYVQD